MEMIRIGLMYPSTRNAEFLPFVFTSVRDAIKAMKHVEALIKLQGNDSILPFYSGSHHVDEQVYYQLHPEEKDNDS